MCVRKDIGFEFKEFLQLVGGEVTSHVFAGINLHKKGFYFSNSSWHIQLTMQEERAFLCVWRWNIFSSIEPVWIS